MAEQRRPSTPYSLDEKFEIQGYWWLPTEPGAEPRRVVGTLSYDPANWPTLTLSDTLRDIRTAFASIGRSSRIPAILGFSRDGKPVTLWSCTSKSFNFRAPGIPTESYICVKALVGLHLDLPETAQTFHSCEIAFEKLEQWLKSDFFSDKWIEATSPRLEIVAQMPSVKKHRVDSIGATIKTEASMRTGGDHVRTFHINARATLFLEPDEAKPIEWYFRRVYELRNLIALCYGAPIELLKLTVYGNTEQIAPGLTHRQAADVFFRQRLRGTEEASDASAPIINFNALTAAGSAVSSWFAVAETLGPVLDLFFTVLFDDAMYTDVRFLLTVQALEIFHRLDFRSAVVDEDVFEEFRKTLLAAVPDSTPAPLQEKIHASLNFLNEPTLRQRLRQLVARYSNTLGADPFGITPAKIDQVVNTRNYLTHRSEKLKERSLGVREMSHITEQLIAWILFFLLEKLGIPDAGIRDELTKHSRFAPFLGPASSPIHP